MKKLKQFMISMSVMSVILGGCGSQGVPQADYDRVVAERDGLKVQIERLQKDYDELLDEFSSLQVSVKINEIKSEVESKNELDKSEEGIKENIESQENEILMEELTEEEYKEQCKEIFYEDIKDKSGVSKGDYVKVETYVQQITIADVYQAASNELWREHNLQLIYFECGALCREYENNYGGQNMVLFSKDCDIEPTKYQTGDCLVLFGEVIEVLKDGWTGRSNMYIIPKYVEKK